MTRKLLAVALLASVAGAADVFGPALEWIGEGAGAFDPWRYPYADNAVGESHLSGPVNHLYMSRPNAFSTRAAIRFNVASAGQADLSVYDVNGRLVKTLLSGAVPAGENAVVWDGTDNANNPVTGGIFWVQMVTHDGYRSGKKMLVLR